LTYDAILFLVEFYPQVGRAFSICKHSPVIIIEVLSKSTRKYDFTTKKLTYFNIQALQEYVVIEQDICQIEGFRKSDEWRSTAYFHGDKRTFGSIDASVSVEDIYYQVAR
jgi:Uma2 family endonuclease